MKRIVEMEETSGLRRKWCASNDSVSGTPGDRVPCASISIGVWGDAALQLCILPSWGNWGEGLLTSQHGKLLIHYLQMKSLIKKQEGSVPSAFGRHFPPVRPEWRPACQHIECTVTDSASRSLSPVTITPSAIWPCQELRHFDSLIFKNCIST